MASGVTHQRVALTVLGAAGVLGVFWTLDGNPEWAVGAVSGATTGALITPDIDQQATTIEESRLYQIPIIGPLIGWAWQWFWYGYALIFAHRGVSHSLVLGTFTRAAYLCLTAFAAWYGVLGIARIIGGAEDFPILPWPSPAFLVPFILAWVVQDWMHWTFDRRHPFRWLAGYGIIASIAIYLGRTL